MDGIVEGAFSHDYSVTLCPKLLGQDPQDAMLDGRFDGLVWYGNINSSESLALLERISVPLVLIHTRTEQVGNKWPTVICDNRQGIGLAVDHLLDLGHRKIAFGWEASWPSVESRERLDGFRYHQERTGLPVEPEDILDFSTAEQLDSYLSGPRSHTAIIAQNDALAADILANAARRGVRVPEELSVVGFDSTAYCNELSPKLTSISQPLFQLGEATIHHLVKVMTGEPLESLELVLPCGFDIRGSTSSLP